MADQVGLAPAPGEDNSSFATKAADVAQRVALRRCQSLRRRGLWAACSAVRNEMTFQINAAASYASAETSSRSA